MGSIPANPDAQNVPSFRRWRFEMKLSPFFESGLSGSALPHGAPPRSQAKPVRTVGTARPAPSVASSRIRLLRAWRQARWAQSSWTALQYGR
jgi:hypothetical protein